MRFVVGSNGTSECTSRIVQASNGSVAEVYLSVLDSWYPSGRPGVADLKVKDLCEHLLLTSQKSISLSVAFNAVCYSGDETTRAFQAGFSEFLDSLTEQGVGRIILAHPVLIRAAKRTHPNLHVTVSSFNMVDNQTKVRYFRDMGVNRIILAAELNRQLGKLGTIVRSFPELEFEIILNNGCNYYCPFEYFHGVSQSHSHVCAVDRQESYTAQCIGQLLAEPWTVLTSPFVRPEDVETYEDLGIEFFKLAGRNASTDWILHALAAYQGRDYCGSIVDILNRTYRLSSFRAERPLKIQNKKIAGLLESVSGCQDYDEMYAVAIELYKDVVEGKR